MRRWAHGCEGHTRMGEVHAHHRGGGPVLPHRRGQVAPPDWVVMNGNRVQVKRKAFERFIDATDVI